MKQSARDLSYIITHIYIYIPAKVVDWVWYLHQGALDLTFDQMTELKRCAFKEHAEHLGLEDKGFVVECDGALPSDDALEKDMPPTKKFRCSGKGASKHLYLKKV